MIRSRYFSPEARNRGKMLRQYREQYKFRVVRNHSLEPKSDQLDGYGEFARIPSASGDEWFFTTRAARDRFVAEYGGEPING